MKALCDICNSAGNLTSCRVCGARACALCIDYGVCRSCRHGRTVK